MRSMLPTIFDEGDGHLVHRNARGKASPSSPATVRRSRTLTRCATRRAIRRAVRRPAGARRGLSYHVGPCVTTSNDVYAGLAEGLGVSGWISFTCRTGTARPRYTILSRKAESLIGDEDLVGSVRQRQGQAAWQADFSCEKDLQPRVLAQSRSRTFQARLSAEGTRGRRACSAARSDRAGTAKAGSAEPGSAASCKRLCRPRSKFSSNWRGTILRRLLTRLCLSRVASPFPSRGGCDSKSRRALEELMSAASARAIASHRNAATRRGTRAGRRLVAAVERGISVLPREPSADGSGRLASHGRKRRRLEAYCHIYHEQNGLVPVPEPIGAITRDNWREFLAIASARRDYRAFFASEVARLGATPAALPICRSSCPASRRARRTRSCAWPMRR